MLTTQETEAGSSFNIPIPSPRSSIGGQTPPDSSASSTHSTQKSLPREEVPDKAVAESKSKDGPQEEDDPLKVSDRADAEPKPRKNRPNKYPKGKSPFDDSDLDDDEQEESRVEGSVDSDSGVGDRNSGMQRSDSEGTLYDKPWGHDKVVENFKEEFNKVLSNRTGTLSIGSPPSRGSTDGSEKLLLQSDNSPSVFAGDHSSSVFTDDSQEPLLQGRNDSYVDGNDIKKTKRSTLRAKYAVQRASFVIPMVSAAVIAIYTIAYATSVYLQDKGSLIAFIINNPKFITVPGIIALSLFAIGIFCAIKQFRNTIEHQIQGKDADEILDKVLELQLKNKGIESVMVLYGNGTISHFRLNIWKSHNGFINIDEKVINRTSKIESVFNDRPLFTVLLTGFLVANVALPLWLYAAGGISNITTFYQNILATNVGLSSLVATGMFVLSIVCFGVHYYDKTNCTNLGYQQEKLDPERANKEIFEEIKEKRTDVIHNHRESKRVCLDISEIRITSCNSPTLAITCH